MANISTKTKILGRELNMPFGIAPIAMQKLIHI
jgi:isopentenyl diphosphate isomerase/L-lactate dehydrogenase-like FMN-dependent dehydrogenase